MFHIYPILLIKQNQIKTNYLQNCKTFFFVHISEISNNSTGIPYLPLEITIITNQYTSLV